nr:modulator protein [Escherichia coli]
MLQQHQDSLLPRVTQGEEGHETAEKRPDLVFINRVLHIVNIHVSDPESFVRGPAEIVRGPAERWKQGGYGKSGLRIQR